MRLFFVAIKLKGSDAAGAGHNEPIAADPSLYYVSKGFLIACNCQNKMYAPMKGSFLV
ncbi:hypothetical protein [Bacillus sp. FJAT-28004]|uniref:hypothetical protein n=1 Tax=Bacillus sp. FJAT-28004 TaxID=1679165 RepID=UPI000AB06E4E|nr:hypothetical protein [Bacillus sp. FJAT-28004]